MQLTYADMQKSIIIFSRVIITNVLPPFYASQCIIRAYSTLADIVYRIIYAAISMRSTSLQNRLRDYSTFTTL